MRAFALIQTDLLEIFEYIERAERNLPCYSFENASISSAANRICLRRAQQRTRRANDIAWLKMPVLIRRCLVLDAEQRLFAFGTFGRASILIQPVHGRIVTTSIAVECKRHQADPD